MNNFLLKLRIVAEFFIVFGIAYLIFNFNINPFLSFIIGFIGIFILFQTLGLIDKLNGYGPYNENKDKHNTHDFHHNDYYNNQQYVEQDEEIIEEYPDNYQDFSITDDDEDFNDA